MLLTVAGYRWIAPNKRDDLDLVPTQLVKQVDILTGGASAVYGSEAVAGVVNFILETDFEGVQIGGQFRMATQATIIADETILCR